MPPIEGLYYQHPETGEPGKYCKLTGGPLLGWTDVQIEAYAAQFPDAELPAALTARAQQELGDAARIAVTVLTREPLRLGIELLDPDPEAGSG